MNSNTHMCIDVMQANRVKFLTAIGHPLCYQKTAYLESNKAEEIYLSLDIILRCYNSGGYKVSNITCDNSFRAIFEEVSNSLDVTMEYTNPQDHKPHIKRNNRTIKNQVRTGLHRTTHKTILQVMIKHLVIASTEKFNLFPAKYGISEYYSPETLVTRKVLDFEKHCQCEFGDYVQANECTDPRNDMRTRCIDGMHLCPAENGTGHYSMDLQTGRDSSKPYGQFQYLRLQWNA